MYQRTLFRRVQDVVTWRGVTDLASRFRVGYDVGFVLHWSLASAVVWRGTMADCGWSSRILVAAFIDNVGLNHLPRGAAIRTDADGLYTIRLRIVGKLMMIWGFSNDMKLLVLFNMFLAANGSISVVINSDGEDADLRSESIRIFLSWMNVGVEITS